MSAMMWRRAPLNTVEELWELGLLQHGFRGHRWPTMTSSVPLFLCVVPDVSDL